MRDAVDPFENTLAESRPHPLPSVKACHTCRHLLCVCAIKATHREDCKYRIAVTAPIAVDCDEHGVETCETCFPCTCPDIPAEEDELLMFCEEQEISVVLDRLDLEPLPPPTPEMLADPLFGAVLGAIRGWKIGMPGTYSSHHVANGEHARLIYEALTPVLAAENGKKGGA